MVAVDGKFETRPFGIETPADDMETPQSNTNIPPVEPAKMPLREATTEEQKFAERIKNLPGNLFRGIVLSM